MLADVYIPTMSAVNISFKHILSIERVKVILCRAK